MEFKPSFMFLLFKHLQQINRLFLFHRISLRGYAVIKMVRLLLLYFDAVIVKNIIILYIANVFVS